MPPTEVANTDNRLDFDCIRIRINGNSVRSQTPSQLLLPSFRFSIIQIKTDSGTNAISHNGLIK